MIEIPAETKKITTPAGYTAEIKGYLSGRDQREFRKTLVSMDDLSKAQNLENVENTIITTCVISLDDSTENVLERCLDLPSQDYQFILDSAQETIQSLTKKKEATSTGSTTTGSEEKE